MEQSKKITGHDLKAMGYPPAKWYRKALEYINENGLTKTEIENYLEQFKLPEPKVLFDSPVPYSLNISADNELETANIDKVRETMDQVMRTPTVIGGAAVSYTHLTLPTILRV